MSLFSSLTFAHAASRGLRIVRRLLRASNAESHGEWREERNSNLEILRDV